MFGWGQGQGILALLDLERQRRGFGQSMPTQPQLAQPMLPPPAMTAPLAPAMPPQNFQPQGGPQRFQPQPVQSAPFMAPQPPPPTQMPPQMLQMGAPQPAKPPGPPQGAPQSRVSQLAGALDPQTWFQIAAGFARGAQDNDWSQGFEGVSEALSGQTQRRDAAADRALRKEDVAYMRQQRQREDAGFMREEQQRAALDAWIASRPPLEQAMLRANPQLAVSMMERATAPAEQEVTGTGQIIVRDPATGAVSVLRGEDGAPVELPLSEREAYERRMDEERFAFERRRALSSGGGGGDGGGPRSPFFARPTGADQRQYTEYLGQYESSDTILASLGRLDGIYGEIIRRGMAGNFLDTQGRLNISRLRQDDPEARALLERAEAEVWPLIMANLRGLQPITEIELQTVIQRTLNPQWTPQAITSDLARMRRAAEAQRARAIAAQDFISDAGSFSTGRDSQGRTWLQVQQGIGAPPTQAPGQSSQGAAAPTQASGAAPPQGRSAAPPAQAAAQPSAPGRQSGFGSRPSVPGQPGVQGGQQLGSSGVRPAPGRRAVDSRGAVADGSTVEMPNGMILVARGGVWQVQRPAR